MMFNPTRDEVRQFFTEAWQKHQAGQILTPLEAMATDWVAEHPEYHDVLSASESSVKDYTPEGGQTNPFLHLSMHLAISEQLSIDQPPGIRAAHDRLAAKLGSSHDAQHEIMECLGETMWDAQRTGMPPDHEAYLDRIKRRGSQH
jgi:hypothetical protein